MNGMRSLITLIESAMTDEQSSLAVNESLTSPAPYTWVKSTPQIHIAEFEVGGTTFMVWFSKSERAWHMNFRPKKRFTDKISAFLPDEKLWNAYFGVTGSGMAFPVMSTVMSIVLEFLKSHKPKILAFTAKEASREKLYQAILNRHQSDLRGLGYKFVINDRDPGNLLRYFFLVKTNQIARS